MRQWNNKRFTRIGTGFPQRNYFGMPRVKISLPASFGKKPKYEILSRAAPLSDYMRQWANQSGFENIGENRLILYQTNPRRAARTWRKYGGTVYGKRKFYPRSFRFGPRRS